MEVWKDIAGYEGYYQVSNLARVKGLRRVVNCMGGTRIIKEKIYRASKGTNYLYLKLKRGKSVKHCLLHRLVAIHHVPNPENKPYVNHLFGNKLDCRACELEWTTAAENNSHAFKIGLKSMQGVNHTQAILNDEIVRQIRSLKGIFSQNKLAEMFSVARTTISSVHTHKSWNHIK